MNPDIQLGTLTRMIHHELERQINKDMNPYHLTRSQMMVLFYLHSKPDYTASQKELEAVLDIAQPTAVRLLKGIESKHFIKLEIGTEHNAKKQVTLLLTDPDFWNQLFAFNQQMLEKIQTGFSDEELILCESFLKRILNNLKAKD